MWYMYLLCFSLRGCLHGARPEDPSTRKILEGEKNFHLLYTQKFRSGGLLEIK